MNNFSPGRFTSMTILRMAVAAYLVYLGFTLIRDQMAGQSSMPPLLAWAFGLLFILAGGLFCWYSWKRSGEEEETPPEEPDEDTADETEE